MNYLPEDVHPSTCSKTVRGEDEEKIMTSCTITGGLAGDGEEVLISKNNEKEDYTTSGSGQMKKQLYTIRTALHGSRELGCFASELIKQGTVVIQEQAFATMSVQRDIVPRVFSDPDLAEAFASIGSSGEMDERCFEILHAKLFDERCPEAKKKYMQLHDAFAVNARPIGSSEAEHHQQEHDSYTRYFFQNAPVGIFGLQSERGAKLSGTIGRICSDQPKVKEVLADEQKIQSCNTTDENGQTTAPAAFSSTAHQTTQTRKVVERRWCVKLLPSSDNMISSSYKAEAGRSSEESREDTATVVERLWLKEENLKTPGGIWKTNAFGDGREGGIFEDISRLNHSCEPNCKQRVLCDTPSIVATRDIAEGEELTICYTSEELRAKKASERRAWLLRKYNFLCSCRKCTAELAPPALEEDQAEDCNYEKGPALQFVAASA
ncbi:unnamed protein product [Amoebophrya sp. A120]|nr:unnamed protein product [Amoebophrya sp. A120]|eukprot:GSA120T00015517001.1